MREGAEVADAGVDVELAVRFQAQQAVEARETGRMEGLADADARHPRAVLLAAAFHAFGPVELRLALVERVAQVGAGHHGAFAVGTGAAGRAVHGIVLLPDRNAVELEFARRAIHQRLHDAGQLVLAGATLRSAR